MRQAALNVRKRSEDLSDSGQRTFVRRTSEGETPEPRAAAGTVAVSVRVTEPRTPWPMLLACKAVWLSAFSRVS